MTGLDPYQVDAERALLGILMAAPQLAESCGVMPADLCPTMGHPEILGAILTVYDTKGSADPILVGEELIRRDQANRIGVEDSRGPIYLAELVGAARGVGTLGHYARIIRGTSARRGLHEIGMQLAQAASTSGDLDAVFDRAAQLAAHLGQIVDTPLEGDAPIPGLGLVGEFVDQPSPPHSWVIPGLIERGDRVMIVAGEGAGKSVLGRQLCAMLAAGRHPFSPKAAIRPRRTLLIDLENPVDLVRRNLRGIVGQVRADGLDVGDRAWKWLRPGGLDLRSQADRTLVARVIEKVRPDLVAFGPLYKASLARAGDSYEVAASETAAAIDHLRERYGCAWWIEHHAPKADAAGHRSGPIGSSYWMRWPEFGLYLRQDRDVEEGNVFLLDRFRGDRDERAWPDKLIKRAGRYPWTPDWDDAAVQQQMFEAIDEDRADEPAQMVPAPRPAPLGPSPDDIEASRVAARLREQPAAVAGPTDHSPPASREQLGDLAKAFDRAGVADRHERLARCSAFTGRDVASMVELSSDEAARLIHQLHPSPPEDIEPA